MTSHFADIGFWATDMPSGAQRPAGGQGFAMSSDEMRTMLQKAEDQRQTIEQQRNNARILSQADPPAQEPVSLYAVDGQNGVNEVGRYYEGHLNYQYDYLTELIRRLRLALGITEAADQQAADTTRNRGLAE